jgi:uncharacterized membrane protein HdeD (DUF308 family)
MVHSRFVHGAPRSLAPLADAVPDIGRAGFIALGLLLMGVGALSLLFPFIAAFSFNIVIGATLLVGGIATLVQAARMRRWRGRAVQVLLGLLYLGGGIVFIANPFAGIIALTIMLGAFFAADGAARIMLGLRVRPQRAWWLFLMSGLLSLALGVLVLIGLPSGLSIAFLGVVVGINMILTGFSFLCCSGKDRSGGLGPSI